MSFAIGEISPVIEKIAEKIGENDEKKLTIHEFDQIITKIRISKNDREQIIRYLEELGIVKKVGKQLIVL
jgi:hypothetical protein